MKFFQKNKGTILFILLFIAGIYFYENFFKSDVALVEEGASAETIGNDIIALDASLQRVTLDLSLFDTPTYKALTDFTPVIIPQPVGRSHPFNPIGK